MTILLLKPYATYARGATIDLDNATETAMVAQGLATYTVNPGGAFFPLTAKEQQDLRDMAPALAALVSGAGDVVESWSAGSGAYVNTGPVDRTWQLILAAQAKAYAVRVTPRNPQAGVITLDAATVTPSTTFVTSGDPTGGATPVNVTWAGATSIAMTAAASAAEETLNQSDWILVPPVAWTGVTNGRALYYFRFYFALANYSYISSPNTDTYTDNVAGGLVRQWSFNNAAGDKIASPSGYVGTGSNEVMLPMGIEFREVGRVHRMLAIGDSTSNCSTFTVGGQFASWLAAAANTLNASVTSAFYCADNFGWSSQSVAQYSARLPAILAANTYDYVFIQTYSPNSAPTTQAALDANIGRVLDMVARVRASGAIPILTMGIPSALLNAADDAWRLQSNVTFRAFCANTNTASCDVEPTFTDGSTPGRIPAAYSGDGTHITTPAGQAIWAAAAAAAVRMAR